MPAHHYNTGAYKSVECFIVVLLSNSLPPFSPTPAGLRENSIFDSPLSQLPTPPFLCASLCLSQKLEQYQYYYLLDIRGKEMGGAPVSPLLCFVTVAALFCATPPVLFLSFVSSGACVPY